MTIYDFNRAALIDKKITNALTEEHLKLHNKLCPIEAHPELYTNELPLESIEFYKRKCIPRNIIANDSEANPRTQGAREGGSIDQTELVDLENSLHNQGVKLSTLQEKVYEISPGRYKYITGMSRDFVKNKYNFTHIIADVYRAKEGATDSELRRDLSEFGLTSNPKLDPAVPTSMASIQKEGMIAVDEGWVENEFDSIYKRVSRIANAVKLSKTKKEIITTNILNRFRTDPKAIVLPMTTDDAKEWCLEHKFIDVEDKIKYFIRSYDMSSKAIVDSIKYAHNHPKEKVRLIITAGVLGGSPQSQYDLRIAKFQTEYDLILSSFQDVIFSGATMKIKNLELYGAIPSVGSMHDLDKLCFYSKEPVKAFRDYSDNPLTDVVEVCYKQK